MHQSESILSSFSAGGYSSPSIYSCDSSQSLTSHWANYRVPRRTSFLTNDTGNSNDVIPITVSFSSIALLMAEIQREAEFLGDDESKSSDETIRTITLQRVDKSMPKKLPSEACTSIDTDLSNCSLGKPKIETSSSSSIDRTAILDFPCSLSSFPASFLLETYKSKSISEVPLSGLVSAFPSSQALGVTVSCSMSKLDLPSDKSLVGPFHNPLASVLPTADTFNFICERPSAPAPPPSVNGLRLIRSSAALNILRKARSNLKLLSFRSLRNLAKMKIESEPKDNKVPNLPSSTEPRETNESPVQNLPPIASVISKSPHFFSWFPLPEVDSPLRQFESPLSITPSPSCASYTEVGNSTEADTDPKSSTGSDTPKQAVLASFSASLQGSTLCAGDFDYAGTNSITVDHSGTNRRFLSPQSTTFYARQNAHTLRGYRRERIAEIHNFQKLKNDLDVINTFLGDTAEVMVDGSSHGCHLDACTLISSPTKSEGDIAIPELRVSNINDSESAIDNMTTLVCSPGGNESTIDESKVPEENHKKKHRIWSKFGLGSQKPKLCEVPVRSPLSVPVTGPRLNGVKTNSADRLSCERPTRMPVPEVKRGLHVGSRPGSDRCSASSTRHPLHIFTSVRNKVLKTTRILSTK